MAVQTAYYRSPIGIIEVTGNDQSISTLYFVEEKKATENPGKNLQNCLQQIDEYFKGARKDFDLKLEPEGTAFQQKVWKKLLDLSLIHI